MQTKMTVLNEAAELESKLQKAADKHEAAKFKLLAKHAEQLKALEKKAQEDRSAIVSVYSDEAAELLSRLATRKAAE